MLRKTDGRRNGRLLTWQEKSAVLKEEEGSHEVGLR
jgi:hypothetical protein